MKERVGIYLVGLFISALGIALIILSAAGAGPMDTVGVGLTNHFGLTIGFWSTIAQLSLVFITGLIERRRLRIESVLPVVIRSVFLDIWIYGVFRNFDVSASAWEIQWLVFLLGVLGVGVGIGVYMEAKFPKTPVDGLMIAIQERFKWSLNASRITIELSAVLVGFLLGGPVGLGTLVVALGLGRIIQVANRLVPVTTRILSKG